MTLRIDVKKRAPLWVAYSELFLDTELTDTTHMYIANAVRKSGYSPQEAVDILWLEVFPALCNNLRVVAGEWAGLCKYPL